MAGRAGGGRESGGAGRLAEGEGHFRRYLAGQKLKMTAERRRILVEVLGSAEHFTADELHLRFVGRKVPMSRATVYRALDHLVRSGLVRRIFLDRKRAFYEHVQGRGHHEHMICLSCGKVIEFMDEALERRQDRICRQLKFKPLGHTLRIVGLCRKCQ